MPRQKKDRKSLVRINERLDKVEARLNYLEANVKLIRRSEGA